MCCLLSVAHNVRLWLAEEDVLPAHAQKSAMVAGGVAFVMKRGFHMSTLRLSGPQSAQCLGRVVLWGPSVNGVMTLNQ